MTDRSAPIGVFDSGIGGLTVADAIQNVLPHERLIYFGDTAHLPYGEKSAEAIRNYSLRITEFLLERGCKCIVIACNTASSIAFEAVKKAFGEKAMIIDVINPVVEKVASMQSARIGVIATKATVRSNVYAKKLKALNPSLEVSSLATPLLVPMIEEGFYNNQISKAVIASYLGNPKLSSIDTLILACTHFPLIKNEISAYYPDGKVNIIDSAGIVANFVKEQLVLKGINAAEKKQEHQFYVSDLTSSFEESTRIFFRGDIRLQHYPLWDSESSLNQEE